MRTIRGALLALSVGVVLGIGITMQLSACARGTDEHGERVATEPAASPRVVELRGEPGTVIPPVAEAVTGVPDFASLAERLSPVVVNISTRTQPKARQQAEPPSFRNPHEGMPGWPFGDDGEGQGQGNPLERFFGPQPRQRQPQQRSLGSGFIFDPAGYIITNNHVIEGADEVTVRLDNEKEYKAKVVGKDAKTDLAVLQIEGANGLKAATLGDSDALRVGDWVLAIGNPFGLDHTVTQGIVSAKGRFIGAGNYDDYIQTDAAINPGNSGGPLLNLKGEVVGINSAIFSRTGGNIGIGFAIPVNLARELVPQLKDKGKVTRGWLGVLIQKVTPEIAESLGLEEARGALVADVVADGPAATAGIKVGDVIVEFDGKPVDESSDLPLMVARTPVGKAVGLEVRRDKESVDLTVTIAELKDEDVNLASAGEGELGLTVQTLTPEIAENLGVEEAKGVVVTAVEEGTPAEEAGLRRGDVILEVNRQQIEDVEQYRQAVKDTEKGKNLLLLVRRGDNTIFLALKPPPS